MKIQVTNGDSSKILFTYICTMYKHLKLILITVISVAVADEARLSCSVFMVYVWLTSVTHALP